MQDNVKPIEWRRDGSLLLLDQRYLPHELVYRTCRTPDEVADSIRSMVVRGAPAIGVTAAFGLVLAALGAGDASALERSVRSAAELLGSTRPTAVNLAWAIRRMLQALDRHLHQGNLDAPAIQERLQAEAEEIFKEDLEANRRIGELGSHLLASHVTVLTHCNAGALATSGFGTALGVVRAAVGHGKQVAVYAGETRPFLQGSRLTAWELMQDGIDVTLITDGMAAHFFQLGTFDAVIVGADRIAANGDTANKIGTYGLAVLANAHSVPFYVAAPVTTIDASCPDGEAIPIEERSAGEVTETHGWDAAGVLHRVRMAPPGVAVRHPAFDVTPARLISAIITDRGVLRAPYDTAIRELVRKS
ncbi:MAG TPA: S-methyl-5-thioribose-1-phosphate isomerase [Thermoanaerobaculia bacterium]|nr:S-methyl-5-thioribose-1-phosphate isomerase [Thermoanaerobaculia bacterium]